MTEDVKVSYKVLFTKAQEMFAEAERLRKEEAAGAIQSIKELISEYGLTAADLGFRDLAEPAPQSKGRKPRVTRAKAPAKYRGPNGELWAGGSGRKPSWIAQALAQGRSLDEFLIAESKAEQTPV